ncbi:MAG: Uma2 family endonuclease [Polyangiaceae bacterium]|nr:Uma2 family endonuclease [Polyangiaceae bacterium]
MGEPAKRLRSDAELWAELEALPLNLKGEIIDSELHVMPRPRPRHTWTTTMLGQHIGGPFNADNDGPGGWIILVEPGIELPSAPEVAPDVAGWRRERFAWPEGNEPLRIVPDWVCEVLSPSNAVYDRRIKFPFYARIGVSWLWVVEPRDRTVEVRKRETDRWSVLATFAGDEAMRAEPFDAIEIPLGRLWAG